MAAYIKERTEWPMSAQDRESWEFVAKLEPSTEYDFAAETRALVSHYKQELKEVQRRPESKGLPGAHLNLDAELC